MSGELVVPVLVACEDCGGEVEPGVEPIELMRPIPGAPAGKAKRRGGRRWREWTLCRRCRADVLRRRAAKNARVMEGGVLRTLRTSERVPPKKGGRPRLLTDEQLRAAHVIYERGERSGPQIAAALHESLGKGTSAASVAGAMYAGWRRLDLDTRDPSKRSTIMHRDLGHRIGRRAEQIANKRKCSATKISYGRHAGEPCGQWAVPGSDLCAMHTRHGTLTRAERRPRCAAQTQKGTGCKLSPAEGSDLCSIHGDPERARAMTDRMRGRSRTERPENLTTYAAVQPALRRYLEWAVAQPRPATGRPPMWRWLSAELGGRGSRSTELSRYLRGPADAKMMRSTASLILAAIAAMLGDELDVDVAA